MKFERIYIEITNICGLECSFCPTKETSSQIMELDFFEDIVAQSKGYTKEIVFHVMGDPLVLSNLEKYFDIVLTHGMKAMVTTSGFYIDKHLAKTLFHPALRQLNISLNSFNKNNTDISIDKYLEPILSLCEAKLAHYPDSFVNLRLWNLDKNKSENIFNDFVIKKLFDFFQIKAQDVCQKNKGIRLASKILLHFDEYFQWPSLDNPIYGDGYCRGLSSHIAILCDGRVVPCCLDYKGSIELGDLRIDRLNSILNTPKVNEIKDGFLDGKATQDLCKRCSYKGRFDL